MKVLYNKEVIIINEAPDEEEIEADISVSDVANTEKPTPREESDRHDLSDTEGPREVASDFGDEEDEEEWDENHNQERESQVLPKITGKSTIGDLKRYLSIRCSIPLFTTNPDEPQKSCSIRLIHRGKMLTDDSLQINELPGGISMTTVTMFAISPQEMATFQENLLKNEKESKLIRDDFQRMKKKMRKTGIQPSRGKFETDS